MRKIKRFKKFYEELRISTNNYKCPICGQELYRTDAGGMSATLQCSSDDAKFWNFPRGSQEQKEAHDHFTKSTIYIPNQEYNNLAK